MEITLIFNFCSKSSPGLILELEGCLNRESLNVGGRMGGGGDVLGETQSKGHCFESIIDKSPLCKAPTVTSDTAPCYRRNKTVGAICPCWCSPFYKPFLSFICSEPLSVNVCVFIIVCSSAIFPSGHFS